MEEAWLELARRDCRKIVARALCKGLGFTIRDAGRIMAIDPGAVCKLANAPMEILELPDVTIEQGSFWQVMADKLTKCDNVGRIYSRDAKNLWETQRARRGAARERH